MYTSAERRHWMQYYRESGDTIAATCRHFQITRTTFYKWRDRWDISQPQKPLRARSRRPKRHPPTWTQRDLVVLSHLVCAPPIPGRQRIYTRLCGQEDADLCAADTVVRHRWTLARAQLCAQADQPRFSARTLGRMLDRIKARCPVCRGAAGHHDECKHDLAIVGTALTSALNPVLRHIEVPPTPATQRNQTEMQAVLAEAERLSRRGAQP